MYIHDLCIYVTHQEERINAEQGVVSTLVASDLLQLSTRPFTLPHRLSVEVYTKLLRILIPTS